MERTLLTPSNLAHLQQAKTFEDVMDVIRSCAAWGIGEQTIYSFSERLAGYLGLHCVSSEHFGQLAGRFKRVSGSSGLKCQAAIAC